MTDVLTPEQRKFNMSRIRSRNTKPELVIRKKLHAAGFRFRLHRKDLPGNPDIVLPKFKAVILIQGCFWHGHHCSLFKIPASNVDFWREKISKNRNRDFNNLNMLLEAGWRVLLVWECSLKGKNRRPLDDVISKCVHFICGDAKYDEIQAVSG